MTGNWQQVGFSLVLACMGIITLTLSLQNSGDKDSRCP